MKRILTLLAVMLLLPVGAAMADPAEDLREAANFVKSGNKDAAVPLLEGIVADEGAPARVKSQAYFVFSAMESDPAAAVPFLDKAIAADPTFAAVHIRKTEKLYEAKMYAEAAAAAAAALELDPENKQMLQYKANSHYAMGDYPHAAAAFDDCLKADNRNGSLYLLRGHSYLLSRQPDKALADFSTANRYASQLGAQEQADLQYYWGMAYLDAERFDLATGTFNKALGMNPPADRKADLERLIAETADKKAVYIAMEQTRKDLEKAKGYISARRNINTARDMLQKIVENQLVTNELKAQAYLSLVSTVNSAEERLAYADKAVALDPNAYSFFEQGVYRFYTQDPQGAIESLTRTVELQPTFVGAYYFLGVSHLERGEWAAADKEFAKAQELSPDHYGEYSQIPRARVKFMLGDIDGARADLELVKGKQTKGYFWRAEAEYPYVLGLLCQYDKKYSEAAGYYEKALQKDKSGSRGKDLQKRLNQLNSLKRWSQKR